MKGFTPCRWSLKLDDSMIRWIADHLDPVGGYMACCLILVYRDGLGLFLQDMRTSYSGHGLAPELAWRPHND